MERTSDQLESLNAALSSLAGAELAVDKMTPIHTVVLDFIYHKLSSLPVGTQELPK